LSTVQEEDRQNKELLGLSEQIFELTKEVRSYGDTVQEERDQNKELLELSKQMRAVTKDPFARRGQFLVGVRFNGRRADTT
jgi:hypothetical protein